MSVPQGPSPVTPSAAYPSTQVTVGSIAPDSNDAKFNLDNETPGVTTDYAVNNEYDHPQHVLMLPVASPNGFGGNTAVFVQVAAPTLCWRVDWTACRAGGKPLCPSTTPSDANWVFLRQKVEPACITQMADGGAPLYRISGTYWYGYKKVKGVMHRVMTFPRPPWLLDVFDRAVPDAIFVKNIMDYLTGGKGAPSPGSPSAAQG